MRDTHPHTVATAARHLGVSPRTVQRRLAAGELDAIRVHTSKGKGYEWRIRLDTDATTPVVAPTTQMSAMPSDTITTTIDGSLLFAALRESEVEKHGLIRENERLRAEVESLRQERSDAQKPVQRVWWAFWRGRGT